jgi:hypothetical protein
MTRKVSKRPSVSERKSCVFYAGREAVLSVGNAGRLTSQGANSSDEQGKVIYVVVIAEGRAVGDRSRVVVASLCSVVHQTCDQVVVFCTFCDEAGASVRQSDVRLAGLCTAFNISVMFICFIVGLFVIQIHVFNFDFAVHGAMFILGAF